MALRLFNLKLTPVDWRKPWEKTPKNESKDWTQKNALKKELRDYSVKCFYFQSDR
jgi:hypothetical protein